MILLGCVISGYIISRPIIAIMRYYGAFCIL